MMKNELREMNNKKKYLIHQSFVKQKNNDKKVKEEPTKEIFEKDEIRVKHFEKDEMVEKKQKQKQE